MKSVVFAVSLFLFQSAEQWYAAGVRLASAGQIREAIEAYQHAVAVDQRHADAWNNLGDLLRRSGDRNGAIDALNHALDVNPTHPQANLNAALVRIELKHFREALPCIEIAQRGLGDQPVFHYLFARTYLELDDYASAEAHLNRYREAASTSPAGSLELATLLLNHQQPAKAAEMLLGVVPDRRTDEIILRLGQAWYALDQIEKARDAFSDFLNRAPDDIRGYLWRGYAERGLGNLSAAYEALKKALALDPQSVEVLVALGNVELDRGRTAEALAFADGASKANAHDAGALFLRGLALLRLDRAEEAAAALAKISKDSSEYSKALYPLARAYRQIGQIEKSDAALQEFRARQKP